MDKVLLVIPAYNEEKNIRKVVGRLVEDFPELDYIVVNDGSRDSTADICRQNGYNLLDLPVNLGLAGCFQAGMKYAYLKGYQYAIQFDGDGQHRPEYIGAMKDKMDEGYDIVVGSRFVEQRKDWSPRMLGSRLIGAAIRLTTGAKIKDPHLRDAHVQPQYDRGVCAELKLRPRAGHPILFDQAGGQGGGDSGGDRRTPGGGELFKAHGGDEIYDADADFHIFDSEFPQAVTAA